jgi:Domain of unknown function (DUF4136)
VTVRLRTLALCVAVVAGSAAVRADDLSVTVAPGVDFSTFKTFTIRHGTIDSGRPELDNPLFVKKLGKTIRTALEARGLTATTAQPDLVVDFTLTGEDFTTADRSPARGLGPQPRRFTEGTLVIDLSKPGDPDPLWRGVYRDEENTGSKLVQKVPDDARKLIDRVQRAH